MCIRAAYNVQFPTMAGRTKCGRRAPLTAGGETAMTNKHQNKSRSKNQGQNEDKDQPVLNHIGRLVREEERLYGESQLTDVDRTRLSELKVELDQCWDLLRQRRALREFGEDPSKAKVRPAKIVENYEQ